MALGNEPACLILRPGNPAFQMKLTARKRLHKRRFEHPTVFWQDLLTDLPAPFRQNRPNLRSGILFRRFGGLVPGRSRFHVRIWAASSAIVRFSCAATS